MRSRWPWGSFVYARHMTEMEAIDWLKSVSDLILSYERSQIKHFISIKNVHRVQLKAVKKKKIQLINKNPAANLRFIFLHISGQKWLKQGINISKKYCNTIIV